MKKIILKIAFSALSTIGLVGLSEAAPITYNFTAANFYSLGSIFGSGYPVPNNSLTGSVTLDGSTVTQIDLTIATHSYSASEIRYGRDPLHGPSYPEIVIGAGSAADSLPQGTDDFWLTWNDSTLTFEQFAYSAYGVDDTFFASSGSITIAPVPLPASIWVFGSGLIGLWAKRRKIAVH